MSEFIEWESIEVKGNRNGVKKTTCPNCSETRKKKKDPCLYVNFDSGVAKCFHCNALGFRDEKTTNERVYTLPPQTWMNYTSLSDNLVKWCSDERKIRQETLIHFSITEEKNFQPQIGREVNNIVFNYFEGSNVVNKKYRSANKNFTSSAGGKPVFYNINSVIGSDEVYIVEGEFDVLAMYEAGVESCISLPNGANDNDSVWINCEKYLKDVKRFIIATDNDEKGIDIREKIAQRLGRYKCSYIEFNGKDANEDLISGELSDTINNVRNFPVSGTFTVSDLYSDILDLYDKGLPETIKLKGNEWNGFNKVFSTMRGHLIVGTGIPSHGKSTLTEFYCLKLIKDNSFKVSFFSPEHSPMQLHQANFIQKAIGKTFFNSDNRVSKYDIERYKKWANEKLYLTAPDNGVKPTWTWLFEKFKEQIFTFGIDVFVIDAFNKLLFDGIGGKEAIDQVLTELTAFAQANNVLIFLIAHPTKMKKDEKTGLYVAPTLYDVSGSSDFRNQTHDGYCVYRVFDNEIESGYTRFINLKTKYSFQGEIGASVDLLYDKDTSRYYQRDSRPDKSDWTEDIKDEQSIIAIKPNEDFDMQVIEYCPF